MGDCTVSTRDTTIYYPSDWLVDGGPPFESMGCPQAHLDDNDEDLPLRLIYNKQTRYFGVVQGNDVLMESKDRQDIAGYIKDYVEKLQLWVHEQDLVNDEAEKTE